MLLPLITVLFGIAASPLTTREVSQNVRNVVETLDVVGLNVSIKTLQSSLHPSPLLVKSKGGRCTIWVNQGTTAHAMWDQFIGENAAETQLALRNFAVAHEIGHCLASDLKARNIPLPVLTAGDQVLAPDEQLPASMPVTIRIAVANTPKTMMKTPSAQPTNLPGAQAHPLTTRHTGLMSTGNDAKTHNQRYGETFSDLLALRFIHISNPEQYSLVRDHLVKVRLSHGYYDREHDSSFFLTNENVALIADLLTQYRTKVLP